MINPLASGDHHTLAHLGVRGNQLLYVSGIEASVLSCNSPSLLVASSRAERFVSAPPYLLSN